MTAFGAVVAKFSLGSELARAQVAEAAAPESFAKTKGLDGWIRVSPDMRAKAGLSSQGKIVDWVYNLWSNTHAT